MIQKEEKRSQPTGMSVPEVAQALGCSERVIWGEIHARRLAHLRVRRRVVVTVEQLQAYVDRNSVAVFDAKDFARQALKKGGANK